MLESVLSMLERLGTLAGWIVAIVQLLVWIIGVPIVYRRYKRRIGELEHRVDGLENTVAEQREEIARVKDKADAWFQMIMAGLSMMKVKAPKLYRDYVDSYGGEDHFTDFWVVPSITDTEAE